MKTQFENVKTEMSIISLGLGVQSVAMYYMSNMGILPKADYAIVADTGREKTATYQYLQHLQEWQQMHNGIPIIVKQDKNLFQDLLSGWNSKKGRFASIPAFTKNADGSSGMLRRQCTNEYKIMVVDAAIRELYGLVKRQRTPITAVWKGITLDEWDRMSEPKCAWKIHIYPFTGYVINRTSYHRIDWACIMSRADVLQWYVANNLRIPVKSSCVFCPYQSDANWARLKIESPEDFAAAVQIDYAIRNSTLRGIRHPCYLHKSLQPLDKVNFHEDDDLWAGECSGTCHV
jgi:hypothetical protein